VLASEKASDPEGKACDMTVGLITASVAPGLAAVLAGATAHLAGGPPSVALIAAGLGAGTAALALQKRRIRESRPQRTEPADGDDHIGRGPPAGVGGVLLEHLPLGVVLIDADGQVQFINPAAIELFGRCPPGRFHVSTLRAPKLLDAIEATLGEGLSSTVHFTLSRARDQHLRAFVRPVPERIPTRGAELHPAVMVVIEDQTQSRRAEILHRDFVANASHELKTPLASISGVIETLQGHARDDPDATARFLTILESQTERMKRLVADLLSLNRIELNERVQPRDRVAIRRLIAETVDMLQPVADASGATLRADPARDTPEVLGNWEELGQVLRNLIENAIKYGQPGVTVTIECHEDDAEHPGQFGISVVDDGPGIAREHLPRLTERFYRVSVRNSREKGGTGLGLAIVKHVINRHRGQLEIDSAPGKGTRVTVWLGLASPAAATAERAGAAVGV